MSTEAQRTPVPPDPAPRPDEGPKATPPPPPPPVASARFPDAPPAATPAHGTAVGPVPAAPATTGEASPAAPAAERPTANTDTATSTTGSVPLPPATGPLGGAPRTEQGRSPAPAVPPKPRTPPRPDAPPRPDTPPGPPPSPPSPEPPRPGARPGNAATPPGSEPPAATTASDASAPPACAASAAGEERPGSPFSTWDVPLLPADQSDDDTARLGRRDEDTARLRRRTAARSEADSGAQPRTGDDKRPPATGVRGDPDGTVGTSVNIPLPPTTPPPTTQATAHATGAHPAGSHPATARVAPEQAPAGNTASTGAHPTVPPAPQDGATTAARRAVGAVDLSPRPGAGRPFVFFARPETFDDSTTRLRPVRERARPRLAAAAASVVLGLGLIGGAVTGSWLTGDSSAAESPAGSFSAAADLWHNAPVDQLFPTVVHGDGAGPGGADRTWTRIAVAPDSGCAHAFDPLLSKALAPVGCLRLLRATYTDATRSHVTTVGLLFTKADAEAMRALRVRFTDGGLDRRRDLMPRFYAAENTAAAGFGDGQRASWSVSVLLDAPVVVYAVSGFADGRTVQDPQPAAEATDSSATSTVAQAGLGHEAKGLADQVGHGLRKAVGTGEADGTGTGDTAGTTAGTGTPEGSDGRGGGGDDGDDNAQDRDTEQHG